VFIEESDISFTSHNITESQTLSRDDAAAIIEDMSMLTRYIGLVKL
jgi:hypothetical protein